MRRIASLFTLMVLSQAGSAQSWEKLISPGLSYRMEVETRTPRVMHLLRWSPAAPLLNARSEVAHLRLFAGDGIKARQRTSEMVTANTAIAGINGDFFGSSGEPLGAVIRDGELLSRPFEGRAVFGWGPQTSAVGYLTWTGSAEMPGGPPLALTGINEDVPAGNAAVLFTDASAEVRAPAESRIVVLRVDRAGLAPSGILRTTVDSIQSNVPKYPLGVGYAAIVVTGQNIARVSALKRGDPIAVTSRTDGFDWAKVDNVIGGGPSLVRRGTIVVDWERARFTKSFSETRHPRTAIGRTAAGDILMVVIDGRQTMSAGATLQEMAQIMLAEGCEEAINLDGGGSSTLSIFGQVMNRPSDAAERPVANGLLIFGQRLEASTEPLAIQGPSSLTAKSAFTFRLIGADGRALPNREVLWSASGPGGWVDQSGVARTLDGGQMIVRAFYRGQSTSLTATVVPEVKPTQAPK